MARGEGIKHLSSLFEKYRSTLIAPERSVITTFCEVINELYGWDVPLEKVTYTPQSKTLTIKNSGPLRSEVLLRKEEILNHMKGRLGVRNAPKDIF